MCIYNVYIYNVYIMYIYSVYMMYISLFGLKYQI